MSDYINEEFTIQDDKQADWAVKKVLEDESERDRLVDLAKQQIADLKSKIEEINQKYDNNTGFLKSKLAEYFETVPHKESKTQESYPLLSGKLVKKKATFDYKYDDDTLAQFLADEKMNDFLDIKIKPKWGEFKKTLDVKDGQVYIQETGELVDIIEAVEVPPKFEVK